MLLSQMVYVFLGATNHPTRDSQHQMRQGIDFLGVKNTRRNVKNTEAESKKPGISTISLCQLI